MSSRRWHFPGRCVRFASTDRTLAPRPPARRRLDLGRRPGPLGGRGDGPNGVGRGPPPRGSKSLVVRDGKDLVAWDLLRAIPGPVARLKGAASDVYLAIPWLPKGATPEPGERPVGRHGRWIRRFGPARSGNPGAGGRRADHSAPPTQVGAWRRELGSGRPAALPAGECLPESGVWPGAGGAAQVGWVGRPAPPPEGRLGSVPRGDWAVPDPGGGRHRRQSGSAGPTSSSRWTRGNLIPRALPAPTILHDCGSSPDRWGAPPALTPIPTLSMKLTKLELTGFKSFADTVTLTFGRGRDLHRRPQRLRQVQPDRTPCAGCSANNVRASFVVARWKT